MSSISRKVIIKISAPNLFNQGSQKGQVTYSSNHSRSNICTYIEDIQKGQGSQKGQGTKEGKVIYANSNTLSSTMPERYGHVRLLPLELNLNV
jgi:hypothetical protein